MLKGHEGLGVDKSFSGHASNHDLSQSWPTCLGKETQVSQSAWQLLTSPVWANLKCGLLAWSDIVVGEVSGGSTNLLRSRKPGEEIYQVFV